MIGRDGDDGDAGAVVDGCVVAVVDGVVAGVVAEVPGVSRCVPGTCPLPLAWMTGCV